MVPKLNEARELLRNYDQGDFHLLQGEIVSGIMGYFSRQFEPENEEYWAAAGMLHDIDLELYPEEHCAKCYELLREHVVDEQMIHSIVSHGYGRLDWVTVKPMVRPSKSLCDMDVGSIKKKFKKKEFAAGCCGEDMLSIIFQIETFHFMEV